MKKLLSVVLALSMILSMSVTAFAADDNSKDVNGEYTPTHKITFTTAENGSVSASPTTVKDGVQYAKEGETITLTPTPDEGYELDQLTVTDGENNPVTVSENIFTMPTSNVTVTATFKLSEAAKPTAKITGMKISGVSQDNDGIYVIQPGDVVIITVIGEHLDLATRDNPVVQLIPNNNLDVRSWTKNNDNTEATYECSATYFTRRTTITEMKYRNENVYINSGVKYRYGDSVVGVDIEWGKMSFSYDDVNERWDAIDNKNYVIVSTNSKNTVDAISVSAEFTPADLMTEKSDAETPLTTSWANGKNTATLNSSTTSCTFTLNLSGKPNGRFEGKIGTVTLTIKEAQAE